MQIIENLKVKEKVYIEKLENGLTIMIIPKKNIQKKYVIFGTNFGSIDNHFISSDNKQEVYIPDGVAHFLEHKMFEQENGTNSLDTLSALGVDANAYTTNDHTAYLFEATQNFYEALDELMNYVQNPYFTDENVEKEKGIIGQEIQMYEDQPNWQVYLNTLKCLYQKNPVRIDIAGSIESISKIDKEVLYKSYHTFYNLSNMAMVFCGDFIPENLIQEIKKRITKTEQQIQINRIYDEEPEEIQKEEIVVKMDVNNPLFAIGYKDNNKPEKDIVTKHIAIEIIANILCGKSSQLYKELYEQGLLMAVPDIDYEFSKQYAHILVIGQSKNPRKVIEKWKQKVEELKQNGIQEDEFIRAKKKIYGGYVKEYNDVGDISRMFLADYFKGINSFGYIENYNLVTIEYVTKILKECFCEEKMAISIVESFN